MSAQVNNNNFSSIGRMFARQNVPSIYGAGKGLAAAASDASAMPQDTVTLSALAPRPLSAEFLEEAVGASKKLDEGSRLSADSMEKLRENRIFSAMVALAAIGGSEAESMPRNWPTGLPVPTRDEMEAARRRLSQRLQNLDAVSDPDSVQQTRLDLLQKVGKTDFSALAAAGSEAAA